MSNAKSNNIQILRGLAIIAVVFIHNTPDGMAQVYCRPFLNFSVGLFLFLSGLLSDVNKWNPKKRVVKAVIPYVLWTCVYVVIFNYKTISDIPIIFLKNLITGGAAAIMYYIFVYCELTLLIPLVDKLARSKYRYLGLLISPMEIIFFRLLPLVMGIEMNRYLVIIRGISCLGWFTYFYLGYLFGNNIIKVNVSTKKWGILLSIAIIFQMAEGYWYLSMGETNCGTQLKISAIITGTIFVVMVYNFIDAEKECNSKSLKLLGDYSFGIYFSHLAVMAILGKIPYYSECIYYPLNAVVTIFVSVICVLIGKKILGKYSKYLAL